MNHHLIAAIPVTPELIITGLSLLSTLWQSVRAARYKEATGALVESIEYASDNETNPKRAAQMKLAGAALETVNAVLSAKKLRNRSRR